MIFFKMILLICIGLILGLYTEWQIQVIIITIISIVMFEQTVNIYDLLEVFIILIGLVIGNLISMKFIFPLYGLTLIT